MFFHDVIDLLELCFGLYVFFGCLLQVFLKAWCGFWATLMSSGGRSERMRGLKGDSLEFPGVKQYANGWELEA